jgi:hypothetical protein
MTGKTPEKSVALAEKPVNKREPVLIGNLSALKTELRQAR